MFKHHGATRTFEHNLKLATLLSFVAGMVNVTGFISVQRLTTNITGHFAFFVGDILNTNFHDAAVFFLFIFAFFSGSFVSSFLVELVRKKKNEKNMFLAPILLEILILFSVGFFAYDYYLVYPNIVAIFLLFAMGLQNSLVTSISNAIVRTTHLTGLFTDLGIEMSQLIFYREREQRDKLLSTIRLRFAIILFFFAGGIVAGLLYSTAKLTLLMLAAILLSTGLIYDYRHFRILNWRKIK